VSVALAAVPGAVAVPASGAVEAADAPTGTGNSAAVAVGSGAVGLPLVAVGGAGTAAMTMTVGAGARSATSPGSGLSITGDSAVLSADVNCDGSVPTAPMRMALGSIQLSSGRADFGSTDLGLPNDENTNAPSTASNPMPIQSPDNAVQLIRFFARMTDE
jgi:hypothetical protein